MCFHKELSHNWLISDTIPQISDKLLPCYNYYCVERYTSYCHFGYKNGNGTQVLTLASGGGEGGTWM